MKNSRYALQGFTAACAMLLLILDARAALMGAREGLEMCWQTVVPALFPFFVFSSVLTSSLQVQFPAWFSRVLGIPRGGEIFWVTGLLGGYPIGAKCVAQACQEGVLNQRTAERMLGFCSNAGPAFIFGMTPVFFSGVAFPWLLFLVQILSSFLTGILLPGKETAEAIHPLKTGISWIKALKNALQAIAGVCGWIILFRVMLCFCSRWFLWLLPKEAEVILSGFLELSNGILSLDRIASEPAKLILCTAMLNFGGLCVAMQTSAVATPLSLKYYFLGKCLQTLISVYLVSAVCVILYDVNAVIWVASGVALVSFCILLRGNMKKTVALSEKLMYNGLKHT